MEFENITASFLKKKAKSSLLICNKITRIIETLSNTGEWYETNPSGEISRPCKDNGLKSQPKPKSHKCNVKGDGKCTKDLCCAKETCEYFNCRAKRMKNKMASVIPFFDPSLPCKNDKKEVIPCSAKYCCKALPECGDMETKVTCDPEYEYVDTNLCKKKVCTKKDCCVKETEVETDMNSAKENLMTMAQKQEDSYKTKSDEEGDGTWCSISYIFMSQCPRPN